MTDFLTWSPISLGRWFGTAVRVHISSVVFVVFQLVATAVSLADEGHLEQLPADRVLARALAAGACRCTSWPTP